MVVVPHRQRRRPPRPDPAATHRIDRPSAGNAAPQHRRCAPRSARGSFDRRDDHPDRHGLRLPPELGRDLRARAVASGRRVPTRSLTSTMSVLSSITSKARRPGCHARMSMTPRSRVDRERRLRPRAPRPAARRGTSVRRVRGAASAGRSAAGRGHRHAIGARDRPGHRARAPPCGSSRATAGSRWPRSMREIVDRDDAPASICARSQPAAIRRRSARTDRHAAVPERAGHPSNRCVSRRDGRVIGHVTWLASGAGPADAARQTEHLCGMRHCARPVDNRRGPVDDPVHNRHASGGRPPRNVDKRGPSVDERETRKPPHVAIGRPNVPLHLVVLGLTRPRDRRIVRGVA